MACLKLAAFIPHHHGCHRNGDTWRRDEVGTVGCGTEVDRRGFVQWQKKHVVGIAKCNSGNVVGLRRTRNSFRCEVGGGVEETKKTRILIAGGGIAGLVVAIAAKKKGFDVKVFERDMSAVRGEGRHRGPIQLQSNALAVLESIDEEVTERIMDASCITGNRINGLVDGISGCWYVKYDLFTPAAQRGLPATRVISRIALQDILVHAVGSKNIFNNCNVVDFKDEARKVAVILEDGREFEGDVLVGADGIWSKVREKLFGWQEASYSNYTCYSGIADFVPPDINSVGYRVFLGHKKYFVSSDVGHGKMQWYAFHHEPAGNIDPPAGKKKRILELFGNWCHEVVDLLLATPESVILRRDIYDRDMIHSWSQGCVTLIGDAAHPMQPNLGQGGCMAIEDSYQLVVELEKASKVRWKDGTNDEIASALLRYERKRISRVSAMHAMSRMAARMVSSYQPYLARQQRRVPFMSKPWMRQPLIAMVQLFISCGMKMLTYWILTGSSSELADHVRKCRLSDNRRTSCKIAT
ncbi:zeaxanthin epoxidase, chloroplastic-like [Nymphaea colorata]|nr:zeaxanthin epoxidase, chloroplastic-like [Nymphaea colorata]